MEDIARRLRALGWDPSEVEEAFIRSGGKGGQNVNKVASCVLLRHRPSGLVIRCDEERSQAANRARAWERLAERLEALAAARRQAARSAAEKERRRRRPRPRRLKERLLQAKKRRGELKRLRRRPQDF